MPLRENVFYVYEHARPDTGAVFYVGKGRGRRAFSLKKDRNRHHQNIRRKLEADGLPVGVVMVAEDLSEGDALSLECTRIAFWRAQGVPLVNLTDGGDGLTNPSAETRAAMSAAGKGRKVPREVVEKRAAALRGQKRTPEQCSRIAAANIGKPSVHKGKSLPSETCAKISAARKGTSFAPEHRAALSAAAMARKPRPHSEATRAKISAGRRRHLAVRASAVGGDA